MWQSLPLIQASSTAAVQAEINGGKFTKALENAIYNALIDTAHAELAKNIKGIKSQANANKWYREAAHKIAHAVAGCGAAAGRGGKCTDGALGAVLGEVVGELLIKGRSRNEINEIDVLNKTKLVVGSVAAITGREINVAVAAAHIAVKYNTVNKSNAETIEEFIKIMNNSPSKSGTKIDKEAEEILIKFSSIGNNFKPNFVTYFNKANARYIYTEKGSWIDMTHFLFYAGTAYSAKQKLQKDMSTVNKSTIENLAISGSMAVGYIQEIRDTFISTNSAFEYEDIPSDLYGARFGARYFNPNSHLSLADQIKSFFNKNLNPTNPKSAPNYDKLPDRDDRIHSGYRNYLHLPLFTK